MRKFENDNPFAPWNREELDSPFRPYNSPYIYQDDPFAPWNSPIGDERDYKKWCDDHHIPEHDR